MTTPRRTRLSSTLMLLLFLLMGGGVGVSGFDVLLFHLNHREEVQDIHVEAAGANCHAESCLIGYVVSGGRFLSTSAATPLIKSVDRAIETPVHHAAATPAARQLSPLPRSPPLLTL